MEGEHGRNNYGHLHTGDRIEVWAASRNGSPGLTYTAEIFCGEGAIARAEDAPKFKVFHKEEETEGASDSIAEVSVDKETGKTAKA